MVFFSSEQSFPVANKYFLVHSKGTEKPKVKKRNKWQTKEMFWKDFSEDRNLWGKSVLGATSYLFKGM